MKNRKELEALGKELAKGIKTQKDLAEFSQILSKITVEAALNAELDDHLGYDKGVHGFPEMPAMDTLPKQ